MADGLVIKPEADPPAINQSTLELTPLEDRDALVIRAAAKVAAAHERCLMMWGEEAARDPSFAELALKRRNALEALMALPARTATDCSAKLDILLKVTPWMGDEDAQLFEFMVEYAQEVTELFKRSVPNIPFQADRPRAAALHRSVRRLFGVAFSGII